MKKILFIISLLISTQTFSQKIDSNDTKEYLALRVSYGLKSNTVVTKISMDIGLTFPHSLRGMVESIDNDVIKITDKQGKSVTLVNEIDAINYLNTMGWKLDQVFKIKVLDKEFTQYLFVKDRE